MLMTGYFGGYALDADNSLGPRELVAAADLVTRVQAQGKPVVVHTIFPDQRVGAAARCRWDPGAPRRRRARPRRCGVWS